MRNRAELAKHFGELGFKIGCEVGVCDGTYSLVMEQSIPGVKLYGVDPYITYQRYNDYRRQNSLSKAHEHAIEKLKPYPTYEFVVKTSVEAVKQFADGSLDFVFIDGNHTYDFVKEDITLWTPKVRSGGIVAGHDFYVFPSGDHGVIFAVLEYVSKNRITLKTTDWDNTNPNRDERQPSWYFYK